MNDNAFFKYSGQVFDVMNSEDSLWTITIETRLNQKLQEKDFRANSTFDKTVQLQPEMVVRKPLHRLACSVSRKFQFF